MQRPQYMDIKVCRSKLEETLDATCSPRKYHIEEHKTKKGKDMLKIVVDDYNLSGATEVVEFLAEIDKTDDTVHLSMFELASQRSVEKLLPVIDTMFAYLAKEFNGDYVSYYNDKLRYIVKGEQRDSKLALIPPDFEVPLGYSKGSNPYDSESETLTIKKSVGEYINENSDLALKLKDMKYPENLNYLAKHLMQRKISEDINFDEFLDLFRQCSLLGADDPSVLKFNKILKL